MTPKVNKNRLSTFYKNILIMFKGTLIAQIIAVISSLFIAKIYGSEAYGILSVFIGFSSIVSVFNSLQLDNYIVTCKDKLTRHHWFNFLFLLIPIMTVIGTLLLLPFYLIFIDKGIEIHVLIFILLSAILLSYNKTHEFLLTNHKKFSPISFGKILLVLINVLFQFTFYVKFKLYGLVYSSFISLLVVTLYFSFKNKIHFKAIDFKIIRSNLKKNNSIITFLLPSRFINNLASQSIPLFIFAFFSLKDAGIYFFCQKILTMPLFIISSSISTVYFERASSLMTTSKKELFNATKKIIRFNILTMFLFLVLLNTVGVYLLELFLTDNWINLRLYLLVLSFLVLSRSSFSPISNIIVVLDKNNVSLFFNVYLLLVNSIAFYIGFVMNDLTYTIYLLSSLGGIGYITLADYFLKIIKKQSYS
ncbi:oligosaccharide flippase family protein [Polaribacter sp.]|nr:oligosaccharide flippase family protein [Polaribacter sp.]MDA9092931.1 oligosaccharide flippase family protein [Polaribacter sp.]MDA9092950.1 oligosaccharide flippase family protein [Polaribacter sp.]MDB4181737.1 oligosaccharide flippase family protein [Polaribacter sp.]